MLKALLDGAVTLGKGIGLRSGMLTRLGTSTRGSPPPLLDDPMEALLETQGGREVSFRCPIEHCTHFIGFGFSAMGWHPFVASLLEYRHGLSTCYEDSILRTFYETWQPSNAAEALAGFEAPNPKLRRLPPHCFYLTPWTAATVEQITAETEYWSRKENAEHGDRALEFLKHGLGYFGPTHPAKGRMEFGRLVAIHDRLAKEGYDRSYGDVNVRVLRREHELRFVIDGGGYHRTAALSAAGERTVPARFRTCFTINAEDAELWPQVRRRVWNLRDAVSYFHHLFEFDSREWARRQGLLLEQKHPGFRKEGEAGTTSRNRDTQRRQKS